MMLLIKTLVVVGQSNGLHKKSDARTISAQRIQQQLAHTHLRTGASKHFRPRIRHFLLQHYLLRAAREKRMRVNTLHFKVQRDERVQIDGIVRRILFEQKTPTPFQTIQTPRLRLRQWTQNTVLGNQIDSLKPLLQPTCRNGLHRTVQQTLHGLLLQLFPVVLL